MQQNVRRLIIFLVCYKKNMTNSFKYQTTNIITSEL